MVYGLEGVDLGTSLGFYAVLGYSFYFAILGYSLGFGISFGLVSIG